MAKLYSTKELMDFELRKLNWDSSKVNEKKRCASWTWWVPAAWATRLVRDAYDRGFVDSHENVTFVYEVSLSDAKFAAYSTVFSKDKFLVTSG